MARCLADVNLHVIQVHPGARLIAVVVYVEVDIEFLTGEFRQVNNALLPTWIIGADSLKDTQSLAAFRQKDDLVAVDLVTRQLVWLLFCPIKMPPLQLYHSRVGRYRD